jgi:hypothetical protein
MSLSARTIQIFEVGAYDPRTRLGLPPNYTWLVKVHTRSGRMDSAEAGGDGN